MVLGMEGMTDDIDDLLLFYLLGDFNKGMACSELQVDMEH